MESIFLCSLTGFYMSFFAFPIRCVHFFPQIACFFLHILLVSCTWVFNKNILDSRSAIKDEHLQ